MKNPFYKSLLAMFLIITLCSLTACGGGGGGSSNSDHSSNNQDNDVQTAYEQAQLKLNITSVVNNLSDLLLPAASGRASINISDNLKDNYSKGQKIAELIPQDTIASFISANSGFTKKSDNLAYGNKNGLRLALFNGKEGENTVITRIVADTTGLVAVSYLSDKSGNVKSTLCFAVDKNKNIKGRAFIGKKDNVNYDADKDFNAFVSGDENSIIYQNTITEEQSSFDTKTGKKESMSDALDKMPIYEKHAVGTIINAIITNKDFLFTYPSNSQRTSSAIPESYDLNIPESLKNYLTIEAIDKVIPHKTVGDFIHDWNPDNPGHAHQNFHTRNFWLNRIGDENDNYEAPRYMVMATVPGNEMTDSKNNSVGLTENYKLALITVGATLDTGKGFGKTPLSSKFGEGEENANIRCKILTEANSNYAVGYCYINNGYDGTGYEVGHHVVSTFVFVIKTDGSKVVGRTFDGIKTGSISYKTEKDSQARVYGDNAKYTYSPANGTEETLDYQWETVKSPTYNNMSDN